MPSYLALHQLDAACRDLLGWEPDASLVLLTGASGPSTEPTSALAEVAALIAASATGSEALRAPDSPLEQIRDADPKLRAALDGYLERFGARPMSGDPRDATLGERPDVLVGLLRGLVARARQTTEAASSSSHGLESQALAALSSRTAADRKRFKKTLAFARRAYPTRDGSILWSDLSVGTLRAVALEIGRRLMARGSLSRAHDVFDLKPDEIRAAWATTRGRRGRPWRAVALSEPGCSPIRRLRR